MTTAIQTSQQRPRAIRGEEIGAQFRGFRMPNGAWSYNLTDITSGHSSANIPMLRAVNDLFYWIKRDRAKAHRVLDAWEGYAAQQFMTSEVFCAFIYSDWIQSCVNAAYAGAQILDRHAAAMALAKHLRTGRCIMALCAGWEIEGGRWPGYPVMMTGARSWTANKSRPPGNGYWDAQGIYKAPYDELISSDNQLNGHLSGALGVRAPTVQLGAIVEALESAYPGIDPWGASQGERQALLGLIGGDISHLAQIVNWLELGPDPRVAGRMIRTSEAVAFVGEQSIKTGSTSFEYCKVWYKDGRPAGWWDEFPSSWRPDNKTGYLFADPPQRSIGKPGTALVVEAGGELRVKAQRDDGTYFSVMDKAQRNGYLSLKIPGQLFHDVRLKPRRQGKPIVEQLFPEDGGTPPPPPGPVTVRLNKGRANRNAVDFRQSRARAERMLRQAEGELELIRANGKLDLGSEARERLVRRLKKEL